MWFQPAAMGMVILPVPDGALTRKESGQAGLISLAKMSTAFLLTNVIVI